MDAEKKFFVRGEDGADQGERTFGELAELARQDKAAWLSVSEDGKSGWRPASSLPELGMLWAVEVMPGRMYGPLREDVLESYVSSGQVRRDAPRFKLHDAGADAKIRNLQAAVEARDKALESMKAAAAASAEETRKTLAALEDRLESLHKRAGSADARSKAREAALAKRAGDAEAALEECRRRLDEASSAIAEAENARRIAEEEAAAAVSARDTECAVWAAEKAAMESQLESVRRQHKALQDEIARGQADAAAPADGDDPPASAPEGEAVVAEVVSAPARREGAPGASGAKPPLSLRDIEMQARVELAQLGAKKGFFGLKGK